MEETGKVTKHPPWRQVVEDIAALNPAPGMLIESTWLYEKLEIQKPTASTPYAKAREAGMQYMQATVLLRSELLTEHQIALETQPGVGYRVVAPGDQTRWAIKELQDEMHKAISRGSSRVQNTRLEQLNDIERKYNADELTRLAGLKLMMRRFRSRKELFAPPNGRPVRRLKGGKPQQPTA